MSFWTRGLSESENEKLHAGEYLALAMRAGGIPMLQTWTCMICGEERPDRFISVISRDISAEHRLPLGTMKMNTRYCNDRSECETDARNYPVPKRKEVE